MAKQFMPWDEVASAHPGATWVRSAGRPAQLYRIHEWADGRIFVRCKTKYLRVLSPKDRAAIPEIVVPKLLVEDCDYARRVGLLKDHCDSAEESAVAEVIRRMRAGVAA